MSENRIGDVVHRCILATRSNIEQCRKYETIVIIRRNVCYDIYLEFSVPLNYRKGEIAVRKNGVYAINLAMCFQIWHGNSAECISWTGPL